MQENTVAASNRTLTTAGFTDFRETSSNTSRSKSNGNLSNSDRSAILSKYDPRAVSVCAKCHEIFFPIWRAVRNEFKRAQISSKYGCILVNPFLAILYHFGLRLSSSEIGVLSRTFREPGSTVDVIKYDDFLRICLVSKATPS